MAQAMAADGFPSSEPTVIDRAQTFLLNEMSSVLFGVHIGVQHTVTCVGPSWSGSDGSDFRERKGAVTVTDREQGRTLETLATISGADAHLTLEAARDEPEGAGRPAAVDKYSLVAEDGVSPEAYSGAWIPRY
ncbi:hypothetical protein DHEL01_v210600 [Diaporthe helianthi]|uniref:Uncharacterized protein n=1 Tax=Diaporthe helianthi TaxID=158607 RepID=A0A2P5HLA7_DIAHE|nr:hypothetical protein DHEL01_v210600 [Diaporthe helianthi]